MGGHPCCYLGLLWIDPAWQEAFQDSHWGWSYPPQTSLGGLLPVPRIRYLEAMACRFPRSAGLEGWGVVMDDITAALYVNGSCVYLGECSSKPQGWKICHGIGY